MSGPTGQAWMVPSPRAAAFALAIAVAYFLLSLAFYDPSAFDDPTMDSTALTVTVASWILSILAGGWLLGRNWGAGYGLLLTGLQIPVVLLATGHLQDNEDTIWWLVMALVSIVFGGITGALAEHYREARVRNAELASKNLQLERTTHALMQSEKMFREFAEHVELGVWILPRKAGKADDAQLYVNPAGRRLYGDNVGTARWAEHVHPDDLPRVMASGDAMDHGHPQDIEFRIERPREGIRWLRTQAFPIRDREGNVTTVVGILDDITERKEREARRELLERRERMSALGTLVAGVAHEINNPLTYLMGNMQLAEKELERSVTDGADQAHVTKAKRLLRTSVEGGERIAKIVRALRAVTRTRSQDERAPVRLNAVASDVHELIRTGVPATIHLELALAKEDPVVEGNASELYQVLLNLATNAIQALGTRPGRVTIETRREGDGATLAVRDDGPGIPPEVRGRLFTPFYTTKTEGTGLGLSIAHAIVRDHGGEVEVESEPGRGALFRVRLPLMTIATEATR